MIDSRSTSLSLCALPFFVPCWILIQTARHGVEAYVGLFDLLQSLQTRRLNDIQEAADIKLIMEEGVMPPLVFSAIRGHQQDGSLCWIRLLEIQVEYTEAEYKKYSPFLNAWNFLYEHYTQLNAEPKLDWLKSIKE